MWQAASHYLLLSLLTFIANTALLTVYFSAIIIGHTGKSTIHRDAFKIVLPGTILGSAFILLAPTIPALTRIGPISSPIDLGVTTMGIIWMTLTKRYCETSWLSSFLITVVAVIIYVTIMFFIGGFLMLLRPRGVAPFFLS
jgi:hypothetical protein